MNFNKTFSGFFPSGKNDIFSKTSTGFNQQKPKTVKQDEIIVRKSTQKDKLSVAAHHMSSTSAGFFPKNKKKGKLSYLMERDSCEENSQESDGS